MSGQLHLEACAYSHGDVYTIGPTFRAEQTSNTQKHLAEFHMLEVERAFCEVSTAAAVASVSITSATAATPFTNT